MKSASLGGSTLVVTLLLGTVLTGCGTTSSGQDTPKAANSQVLQWVLGDDVSQLDSAQATDQISIEMLNDAMEGLYRIGKNGNPEPAIAKSVDISTDGLIYTFHLRSGVKWSNGDPVTAQDFEYGWKRLLTPKLGAGYAYIMSMIKGAKSYNAGTLIDWSKVGIKATDASTLVVHLEYPTPYFLNLVAFVPFLPADQKFVEKVGSVYGTSPSNLLYDGPFTITSWKQGDKITMKKNSQYWDQAKVKLKEIDFQLVHDTQTNLNLYNTDNVDVAGLSAKFVQKYNGKSDFHTNMQDAVFYLQFNSERIPAFKNVHIREAISLAINRAQFCKAALNDGSIPALGLVPPTVLGDPKQSGDFRTQNGNLIQDNNSAQAKQLLQKGLTELGLKTMPKFSILVENSTVGKNEATILQGAWKQNLGLDVQLDAVPLKTQISERRNKQYDVVFSGWTGDYNDPMTFLDMWTTSNPNNNIGYSNKQYDEDIRAAYAEVDKSKRMKLLLAAEKLFLGDMPIAPVYFQEHAYLQKPFVKGVYRFPSGASPEFKWTSIEK